jgi:hypothetical protein
MLLRSIIIFLAVLLSGCAAVEKQAFNRDGNSNIKSITIIEPKPSAGFGVQVKNHPTIFLGLLGAIAYRAEMFSKSNSLDEVMKPLKWSLTDSLSDATAKELQAAGYVVKRVKVERDVGVITDYNGLMADKKLADALATDAWLDLSTRDPLYVAGGTSEPYVPSITLTARLVSSKDQKLLYRDDIYFGYPLRTFGVEPVMIPSSQEYQFAEHKDLLSAPARTLAGIKHGVELISKRLAIDLAKVMPTREPVARLAN